MLGGLGALKSIIPGALFPIGIVTALIGVPFFIWLILGRGVNVLEISRLSSPSASRPCCGISASPLHPGPGPCDHRPERDQQDLPDAHLFGELTPDSGDIRLRDQSARQMTQARWRQQIWLHALRTSSWSWISSVIEVVVLGRLDSLSMRLADEDILAAGRALQALGIAHLADRPSTP